MNVSKMELGVVMMVIGVLVAVLYPAVQRARNPNGPHGEVYPTASPDEANRISHPSGVSIIAPLNWEQMPGLGAETPYVEIAARGTPRRRLRSIITVSKCGAEPSQSLLDACEQTQFQQLKAFETCQVLRDSTFDDPASSRFDLYVKQSDVWWQISVLVADRMPVLPGALRQYVETVRFPPRNEKAMSR